MKTGRRGFLKLLAGGAAAIGLSKAESKAKPEKNDDILDSERAKQVMQHSETIGNGMNTWCSSNYAYSSSCITRCGPEYDVCISMGGDPKRQHPDGGLSGTLT